jgi:hypothetical protein
LWKHSGRHIAPRVARAPRPTRPRPAPTPPADGLCTVVPGCGGRWRHAGRHTPKLDPADVAGRYEAGESLSALAVSLRVGQQRIRDALAAAGVPLRQRGQVITDRASHARPIDVEECTRLYLEQRMDTRAISKHLRVKARRVQDVLRAAGVLKPPGGREPGPGSLNAVRLKLTPAETIAVRGRASQLGLSMNAYLRGIVLADLTPADEAGAA